jgi:hypothetical protein
MTIKGGFMKSFILALCLLGITSFVYAGNYTASIEEMKPYPKDWVGDARLGRGMPGEQDANRVSGVGYFLVITDLDGKEVLRQFRWQATGTMTPEEIQAKMDIDNERAVQEVYAMHEGAKTLMQSKTVIENKKFKCDKFVPSSERAGAVNDHM